MPPYALRHNYGTAQSQGKTNQTVLSQLMGHSTLQMTSRYIANNTEAHVQANQELTDKIMSLIRASDQSNPMESAVTECKIDAKVVAEGWSGGKAHKGKMGGSNRNACDYASYEELSLWPAMSPSASLRAGKFSKYASNLCPIARLGEGAWAVLDFPPRADQPAAENQLNVLRSLSKSANFAKRLKISASLAAEWSRT